MQDGVECPTCGKDGFDSTKAMKLHHVMAHDESIAGTEVECANCGSKKKVTPDIARNSERHFCDNDCKGEWQSANVFGESHHQYTRVKIACEHCGDEFEAKQHEKEDRSFCSHDCASKDLKEKMSGQNNPMWAGGSVEVKCKQCGGSYWVDPCDVDGTSFCSKECQSEWWSKNMVGPRNMNWKGGTETLKCNNCGDVFETLPSMVDKRRFCSRHCANTGIERPSGSDHPLSKPGEKRYGPGWTEKKRRQVRIRDQARCQHCGRTEADHIKKYGVKHSVHHVTPARLIDDPTERNAKENLVTLCRGECHHTWEKMAPLRPAVYSHS